MFNKLKRIISILIFINIILNIFFSNIVNKNVYATEQNANSNMIAGANKDENKHYSGGAPGDSTKEEVYLKPWYSRPWDEILRYENPNNKELEKKVRNAIASNAIAAANNDCIGYDQLTRTSFFNEVSKVNYSLEKLTTKCNTDCSAFVCTIIRIVGHQLDIDSFKNIGITTTKGMEGELTRIGFKVYRDSSYTGSSNKLQKADILLNIESHTEIFVGDGNNESSGVSWNSLEIDDITVNLDELNFDFAGNPKNVSYLGKRRLGIWIFSKIAEFIDYIINLILNGIKYSILGYVMAFESIVNNIGKTVVEDPNIGEKTKEQEKDDDESDTEEPEAVSNSSSTEDKDTMQNPNEVVTGKTPYATKCIPAQGYTIPKEITLTKKYVATSTNIVTMQYWGKLNTNVTVTIGGEKVKLKKGEGIVIVRRGFGKNSNKNTCIIQKGKYKGKTCNIEGNKINWIAQLTDSKIEYTKETAEKFINTLNNGKPAQSGDNNLLWTNHYTQRMYYFTRKNKNSNWVLTYYPVKGYKNRYSVKAATGSFAHGTSFTGTVDTYNSKSGHQLYKKRNGFQNIPYYIHKDSPWGSGLHVSGAKGENTLGKPRTHKCVAVPNPVAKWAYNNLHADEKKISDGGKATAFVDW